MSANSAIFSTTKVAVISKKLLSPLDSLKSSTEQIDRIPDAVLTQLGQEYLGKEITNDADYKEALTKKTLAYTESKLKAAGNKLPETGASLFVKGKTAIENAVGIVTDPLNEVSKEVLDTKNKLVSGIRSVCGGMSGMMESLSEAINDALDAFTFDNLFNTSLDLGLSDLMSAFKECKFWEKKHSKKLIGRVKGMVDKAGADGYISVLKTQLKIPDSIDKVCKISAISNKLADTSVTEHIDKVQNIFNLTGDAVEDFCETTVPGLSNNILDVSSDIFNEVKTDIKTASLFADKTSVLLANNMKEEFNKFVA
ncbi:MAG: hypothetical protein GY804_09505 [Alphaproteobacteria bacterium]|nr:hypothetical protein [Alphaproteobacteria bacterium]